MHVYVLSTEATDTLVPKNSFIQNITYRWAFENETRTTTTPAFWGYPRRPMITHTIDQFILNPMSILLTSSYRIPSQNKVKAEKLEKIAKN